jgi:hypothetical protein
VQRKLKLIWLEGNAQMRRHSELFEDGWGVSIRKPIDDDARARGARKELKRGFDPIAVRERHVDDRDVVDLGNEGTQGVLRGVAEIEIEPKRALRSMFGNTQPLGCRSAANASA